jgi:hypothetical protein
MARCSCGRWPQAGVNAAGYKPGGVAERLIAPVLKTFATLGEKIWLLVGCRLRFRVIVASPLFFVSEASGLDVYRVGVFAPPNRE